MKINTSKSNKQNIFIKQRWFLLVLLTNVIILILGLINTKPFDLGSYIVTVAIVDLVMFYFILAKVKYENSSSKNLSHTIANKY